MATRKRIPRSEARSEKVYTRAGEGPADSPFADWTEAQREASLAAGRKMEAQWKADRAAQRPLNTSDLVSSIRHGVKSERDTQPVQVRMLKAQIKVLKQVAEQENRSASDVIRDLVDSYIVHCLSTWPEGPRLDILRSTLEAEQYRPLNKGASS